MSDVEHVITQTNEAVALSPAASVEAAITACTAAAGILLEAGSQHDSPPLRDIATAADIARVQLVGSLSMLSHGRNELATYIAMVGGSRPEVHVRTEELCSLDSEALDSQLYIAEGLSGVIEGYRSLISANDLVKNHHVACAEALRHPGTRDRALRIIKKLLESRYPGHEPNSAHNHERHRGADLAVMYCAKELIALAEQTDDIPLATRAKGLLLEAFPVTSVHNDVYHYIDKVFISTLLQQAQHTKQLRRKWHESGTNEDFQAYENEKNNTQIVDAAVKIIGSHGTKRGHITRALLELENSDDQDVQDLVKEALEAVTTNTQALNSFLASLGLPMQEIVESWKNGYFNASQPGLEDKETIRKKHLETIKKLERHRHGTVAAIYKKLRIRNFERFPTAMLLDTIDRLELGPPPEQYALYIQGTRSHNEALRVHEEMNHLHSFSTTLRYPVIPMEFNCEEDLDAIHETLTRAGWPRTNSLIIHSHGRETGITPGDYAGYRIYNRPGPYSIKTKDIISTDIDSPAAKIARLVAPEGTITLRSCNTATGDKVSFAWQLNQATGRKTIAPADTVWSKSTITHDPGTGLPIMSTNFYTTDNTTHNPAVYPATGNPL